MSAKKTISLILLLGLVAFVPSVSADTYSSFETTRYYSANRRYFVIVTEKKRATLYRNGRRLRRVWSRTLSELPQKLFITNDGERVAIVDQYYGNGRSPEERVVIILNEKGNQIASHRLGEVANLVKVLQTTSTAHWYGEAHLSPDEQILVIETQVMRLDWDECRRSIRTEEMEKCWETVPYQQLRFALATGALIDRLNLASR
jgi:hypothetical protein